MGIEVLWNEDKVDNFLEDVKSFAMSLDFYEIRFDVESDSGKQIRVFDGGYEFVAENSEDCFKCPACKETSFEILEGSFQQDPVFGFCCLGCDTYGAVFPCGL
ncbi:MAG: hypothetical protein P8P11_06505 [Burkholderiales bacterium]|nr:hypothetical protein [Burkholderiales bacterium]